MDRIDWKSITAENVDELRDRPEAYVHGLIMFSQWTKIANIILDENLSSYALTCLKEKKVQKMFINSLSTEKVLELLDLSCDPIRAQLFLLLIKNYDNSPIPQEIGKILVNEMNKHRWAFNFPDELFSLQSNDDLKTAFNARFNRKNYELEFPRFWKKLMDPKRHWNAREYKHYRVYISYNQFVTVGLLKYRKSFSKLIGEILIEALNGYDKKIKKYIYNVIQPAVTNFFNFKDIWLHDSETRQRVSEALLNFPFEKVKKVAMFNLLFEKQINPDVLRIRSFIDSKIVTPKQLLEKVLPRCIKAMVESEPNSKQFDYLTEAYLKMLNSSSSSGINLLNFFKFISVKNIEHPCSKVYPALIEKMEYVTIQNFRKGEPNLFNALCKYINTSKIDANNLNLPCFLPQNSLALSYDFIIKIIISLIKDTISRKSEIVQKSPAMYSTMMYKIMKGLLNNGASDWTSDECFSEKQHFSSFYMLPVDLRDEIVIEYIKDPTGKKPYNSELAKCFATVPIGLLMLVSDLRKIAEVIKPEKAACDKYGFLNETIINFPPYINQETRNAESVKVSIHAVEKMLIPFIKNKDEKTVNRAFSLYFLFVKKLTFAAIKINEQELYRKATDVYFRLMRFYLSKLSPQVQDVNIEKFISTVFYVPFIYVGSKGCDNFVECLFEKIISKAPYSTQEFSIIPMSLLEYIINYGYSNLFPTTEAIFVQIIPLLIKLINSSLPKSYGYNTISPSISTMYEMVSEERNSSLIKITEAQSKLLIPEKFSKIILGDPFSKKLNSPCKGVVIDTSIITKELLSTLEVPRFYPSVGAAIETMKILKQMIESYHPSDIDSVSTKVLQELIKIVKNAINENLKISMKIPEVKDFSYESSNTYNTYIENVRKFNFSIKVAKSTILFVKNIHIDHPFYKELFKGNPIETFTLLDEVLNFKPYNFDEERKMQNDPPLPKHFTFYLAVYFIPTYSILCRLTANDEKPIEKKKSVQGAQNKKQENNKTKVRPFYEKWMCEVSSQLFDSIFDCDFKEIANQIKEDGDGLTNIIQFIESHIHKRKECNFNAELIGYLYKILIEDILVQDEGTKAKCTLFNDGKTTTNPVKPLQKKNYVATKNTGLPYYQGTKALIGHLSRFVCDNSIAEKIDISIFAEPLTQLISLPPDLLKSKIGDDNQNHFTDYFCQVLCSMIDFGDDEKPIDWAKNQKDPKYLLFFKLFACDVFNYICLEIINQKLQTMIQQPKKNAIITAFISALVSLEDISFTLHTRTKVASWCLETEYAGFPIPDYSLKYINELSKDPKIHIDLRRTIAASIVSNFKQQSIVSQTPTQTNELFEILNNIYETMKNQMTVVFCQLVRPKLCYTLEQSGPIFKELMPKSSFPVNFITPQLYNLSMPKINEWKEYYQKYLTMFVGPSLLSSDDKICQLVIKVLTKIGIDGGDLADQTAKFMENAFKGFNVRSASTFLINFAFNFCFSSSHQEYTEMIDAFINLFGKLRAAFDEVNEAQMNYFWMDYSKFDSKLYTPLFKTFDIFIQNFSSILENLKNKEDCLIVNKICRRIHNVLCSDKEPLIFNQQFNSLCNTVQILCSEDLIKGIYLEPSEEALTSLIKFVKENALITLENADNKMKNIISKYFARNKDSMTLSIIKNLTNWELEIAQNPTVQEYIQPILKQYFSKVDKDNTEIYQIIPKLWKFSKKI